MTAERNITFRWDHRTSPSTCVVGLGNWEIFRGTYKEAIARYEELTQRRTNDR